MPKKSDQDLPSLRGDQWRLIGHKQLTHKWMCFHIRWLVLWLGLCLFWGSAGESSEYPGAQWQGRGSRDLPWVPPGPPLVLALLFAKHIRQLFLVLESHFILNGPISEIQTLGAMTSRCLYRRLFSRPSGKNNVCSTGCLSGWPGSYVVKYWVNYRYSQDMWWSIGWLTRFKIIAFSWVFTSGHALD